MRKREKKYMACLNVELQGTQEGGRGEASITSQGGRSAMMWQGEHGRLSCGKGWKHAGLLTIRISRGFGGGGGGICRR